MGDVLSLRASLNDSEAAALPGVANSSNQSSPFEAAFKRDELGLELERSLPGGVRAQWQRDSLGRPIRQEIWSRNQFQGARQYSWEVSGRLKSIVDAMSGPVHFTHDALGNLAAASYADGSVDLRMPD